jgi:putative transcriptional regulator
MMRGEIKVIRFRLKELIAEKEFQENRRITLDEIAAAVDLSRPTLSRIINERGYSTSTAVLDRLCEYFSCGVGDLAVYIASKDVPRKK